MGKRLPVWEGVFAYLREAYVQMRQQIQPMGVHRDDHLAFPGQVPPGCAPYIATLLIGATRCQGGPHFLSTHLNAAGKRLAIEVCFSQV